MREEWAEGGRVFQRGRESGGEERGSEGGYYKGREEWGREGEREKGYFKGREGGYYKGREEGQVLQREWGGRQGIKNGGRQGVSEGGRILQMKKLKPLYQLYLIGLYREIAIAIQKESGDSNGGNV